MLRARRNSTGKYLAGQIRQRSDGSIAFDDGVNEVSGTWVLGRPPMSQAGLLIYIMVESVTETAKAIAANGGKIVRAPGGDPPQITALFLDPASNLLGIGEQ